MTTTTIQLTAGQVKALLLCMPGKGRKRPDLGFFALDFTGPVPVAVTTDGHRLLAVRLGYVDGAINPGVYPVPREAFTSVKPRNGTFGYTVTLTDSNDDATLMGYNVTGQTTITGRCNAHGFPLWRQVVPLKVSGEPGTYNPHYMAAFATISELLGVSDSVRFAGDGPDCPALVHLPGNAFGVLMGVRTNGPPDLSPPDWFATKASAAAAGRGVQS